MEQLDVSPCAYPVLFISDYHRRKTSTKIICVCKKYVHVNYTFRPQSSPLVGPFSRQPQYPGGGFDDDWSCDGNAGFWGGGWNSSHMGRVMNKPNKGNNTDQQQQGAGDKAAEGKPASEAPAKEEAKSSA